MLRRREWSLGDEPVGFRNLFSINGDDVADRHLDIPISATLSVISLISSQLPDDSSEELIAEVDSSESLEL